MRVGPSEQEQWLCVSGTGRIGFPKKSARRWTRSPPGMTMRYPSSRLYGRNMSLAKSTGVNGKRGVDVLREVQAYRRPWGMHLSLKHKGQIEERLRNWPFKGVRVICATSGGRTLRACAPVPPQYLLPMHIDCGASSQQLVNDPLYLGLPQPRLASEELDAFVDEFVDAVQKVFPGCCIDFEDWAGVDAVQLLERYRHRVCCY